MTCRSLAKPLLLPGLVLLLSACGGGGDSGPSCEYASGNLLEDTSFTTLDKPRSERAWRYSQHAGDRSFRYGAKQGTLSFEKTGSEPWALLAQSIDAKRTRGKRIEFSAELKLDLKEPVTTRGFGYGAGLSLLVKHNNRLRLSSSFDHEPHMGEHDWQTARVVADIPKGSTFLRAGFVHQAGGSFQVRNPQLRIVAGGCEPTVTEK